jgi:hypothetical protein
MIKLDTYPKTIAFFFILVAMWLKQANAAPPSSTHEATTKPLKPVEYYSTHPPHWTPIPPTDLTNRAVERGRYSIQDLQNQSLLPEERSLIEGGVIILRGRQRHPHPDLPTPPQDR